MMTPFLRYFSWFDVQYELHLRGRYPTLRIALNLLLQQPTHTIVETGCIRGFSDYGGGNSTFIFGEFIKTFGGKLITIDISPENMSTCKIATESFARNITYITEDSLNALPKLTEPIDLLYLDSFDAPEDDSDPLPCQEHNLKEFKLAEPLLHKWSIVLIDDNFGPNNGGKSRLTKDYMSSRGYICIFDYHQTLWVKN